MSRIRWYGPTLVLLITMIGVMVAGPGLVRKLAHAGTEARIALIKNTLIEDASLTQLSESFEKVADVVEPSVVHLEIRSQRQQANRSLRDFFMRPDGRIQPREDSGEYDEFNPARPIGNGSGWVYSKDGYIVTNAHVVANAQEIAVKFFDGSERMAEVVATDPSTDIAVIQVEGDSLHPATLADEPVDQGEIVFAFGSPLGFQFSMSQGIVSAKGRQLGVTRGRDSSGRFYSGYENYIQTDAAINRGNSGGPLVNVYGQVVGMNTAIAAGAPGQGLGGQPGFIGLGFAIPVDMIRSVVDQMIDTGKVSRGYLGIAIRDLDPRLAKTYGFEGEGALVEYPLDGSPADKAGIEAEDIVTAVGGTPIDSADELRYRIAAMAPGTDVELTVVREGEEKAITVTLGELPTLGNARSRGPADDREDDDIDEDAAETLRQFGFAGVATFTDAMADEMGIGFEPGVLVRDVRPGSVAFTEGIVPMPDSPVLLVKVMTTPVETVEELSNALANYEPTDPIRVRMMRWNPDEQQFIATTRVLELPE